MSLASLLPVDMHCHGIGRFDFTDIPSLDLQEIENCLAERNHQSILTLYLIESNFNEFLSLIDELHQGKIAGKYSHIAGIGLEGPLLASHGGTPKETTWQPSKQQWQQLANCGSKGLVYIIFSPDAHCNAVGWITKTLLSHGVLPCPGHFIKTNPTESAKALQKLFDVVAQWHQGPTITDHLFNDMPHNFKHAWRSPEERLYRKQELAALNLNSWTLDNLDEKLGPVPATMIRNARKGTVKIAQNFDGEHVDLAIVKKVIEIAGAECFVMMTDSIESHRLAGQLLYMREGSSLLYQNEDIVAAGTVGIAQQINNMRSIGLNEKQIKLICHTNPQQVLMQRQKSIYNTLEKVSSF